MPTEEQAMGWFAAFRKHAGHSLKSLSQASGFSEQVLHSWEHTGRMPQTYNLHMLAITYGITLVELIDGLYDKRKLPLPRVKQHPRCAHCDGPLFKNNCHKGKYKPKDPWAYCHKYRCRYYGIEQEGVIRDVDRIPPLPDDCG